MPDDQPPFRIDTADTDDGSITLVLSGEVDLSNAADLERSLDAAAHRTRTGQITLDLAGLSFIDSTGLRAILNAARAARRLGRTIAAENPQPQIQRLFELTAVDQTVHMRTRTRT